MSILSNRGAVELSKYFQAINKGAKKVGLTPSAFSLLLAGKRKPSIDIAAKIEKEWKIPCIYWTEPIRIYKKQDRDVK